MVEVVVGLHAELIPSDASVTPPRIIPVSFRKFLLEISPLLFLNSSDMLFLPI